MLPKFCWDVRMQDLEVLYLDHITVLCLQHTTLRNVVKSLLGAFQVTQW